MFGSDVCWQHALKLEADGEKPVSKAPKPITPVKGTATPNTDPSKMSMDEWLVWRKEHMKKR